jgi:hypothetical protein
MPSLFRFLILIGVLGGLTYGAMFMLATWFTQAARHHGLDSPGQVRQAALSIIAEWPRPRIQTRS